MHRHHRIAVVLAGAATASAVVDTAVLVASGPRTFVTDDEAGTTAQAVAMSVFLGATFASLAVVAVRERDVIARAGGWGRRLRVPLVAGLVLLAAGSLVLHPLQLLAGLGEGRVDDASGLLALLALLLTFTTALGLGLLSLRRNVFGIGGRVLSLMLPGIALTAGTAVVAPRYASPVYVTMLVLLGIALLGVRAESSTEPGRDPARTPA